MYWKNGDSNVYMKAVIVIPACRVSSATRRGENLSFIKTVERNKKKDSEQVGMTWFYLVYLFVQNLDIRTYIVNKGG